MTDKLGLGLNLGYWVTPGDASALVLAAERLGYESVWTAESWGSDALTPPAATRPSPGGRASPSPSPSGRGPVTRCAPQRPVQ